MKRSRLLSLLLALVLAVSLTLPAAAYNPKNLVPQKRTYTTAFTDTKGTWCDEAVRTCYEAGLMDGKSATAFAPQDPLTYGQILVITARLSSLLSGGTGQFDAPADGEAWYQPAVRYLSSMLAQRQELSEAADYLQSFLSSMENSYNYYLPMDVAAASCDRYDFVWFLAAVLPETALTAVNTITTLPDSGDPDVLRFYNAGILTGSDEYGTFNGISLLNRGQAAAMLARIVDPAQRVTFTPKVLVLSQALLGLAPETALLTVDGYAVSAELYTYFLTQNISTMEMDHYFSYYETYPQEFEAYLGDAEFEGDFGDYLREKKGIDVDAPIDWNTPDKGGMTPAQKVREDTLSDVTQLAVLLNHEKDYPLTAEQKTVEDPLSYLWDFGYSDQVRRTVMTAYYIQENLTDSFSLTPEQLNGYLKDAGCVYGQYAVIYRGDEGWYDSDAEAREAADTVRSQMAAHRGDTEYLEYLIWKYSDDYNTQPGLISIENLTLENRQALERLSNGQVSAVLTEEDRYLVVLKLDPSQDAYISETAASFPAAAQVAAWAQAAKTAFSAAYEAVDIAAAAAAYAALNG